MISYINGKVTDIGIDRAIIEAAGIGYELICPDSTLKKLQLSKNACLLVHFHMAFSQDNLALYGFLTEDERAMFRRLISVTRIGPKLAVTVLSHLDTRDIATAILTENAAAFDSVPGLGRKTAARVLLELKEKISADEMVRKPSTDGAAPSDAAKAMDMRAEATAALVSLGYDGVTAGRAIAAVPDCEKVEQMITLALKDIARKGKPYNG